MATVDIFNMTDTWNNSGVTFAAIKMNVTDTASASGSMLLDLQVGGASKFSVDKNGYSLASRVYVGDTNGYWGVPGGSQATWYSTGNATFCIVNGGPTIPAANYFGWAPTSDPVTGSPDVALFRDAAGVLAQRNSTNAQTFRLYNTYTDASNYERVNMGWSGNVFSIAPAAAGTGTTRVIHLSGLPTANPGPGILWNNAGTPAIGT